MKKDSLRDFPKRVWHNLPILGIQLTNPGRSDNGRVLFNGSESESSYVITEIRGKYAAMIPNDPNNITAISQRAMLLEYFRVKFSSGPTRFILTFYFFYSRSTISRYVTFCFPMINRSSFFEKEIVVTNSSILFRAEFSISGILRCFNEISCDFLSRLLHLPFAMTKNKEVMNTHS